MPSQRFKSSLKAQVAAQPAEGLAPGERRVVRWVLILLAATLAVRLAFFLPAYHRQRDLVISPDSPTYEQPARALVALGRYAQGPVADAPPELNRTPGYPVFIAGVYKLFGVDWQPVLLLQIGLSVVAVYLVFWLGWRLGAPALGPQRGLVCGAVAGLLFALDPASTFYAAKLLTETLYTFFLLLTLVAAVAWLDAPRRRAAWAALVGVLCACSAHVRPVGYFMPLLLLAWMLVAGWRGKLPMRQVLGSMLALFLGAAVLIGGWQWRNSRVSDFSGFAAISGYSLLDYRAAGVVALRDGISLEAAQKKIHAGTEGLGDLEKLTPGERYHRQAAAAKAILRAHPGLMLRTQFHGLLKILFGPADTGFWGFFRQLEPEQSIFTSLRHEGLHVFMQRWPLGHPGMTLLVLFSFAHLAFVYLASIAGVLRVRLRTPALGLHVLLLLSAVYLIGISTGPEAYARFRVPVMPFFCIYAAYGICSLVRRKNAEAGAGVSTAPALG